MHSATDRHIASLQHLLDEIEEEERQYQGHHDSHRPPIWLQDDGAGQAPLEQSSYAMRTLARQYRQVNREHQVTIEACRHTSQQLRSGLFSDREVLFLIERFRSVLNRVRRDHDWIDKLSRQAVQLPPREQSA